MHGARLDPDVELISKPYGRDELARTVRALLDAPTGPAAGKGRAAAVADELAEGDILLTDLGLPGMPGIELAMAARERLPGLPVIFACGRAAEPIEGPPGLKPAS